MMMTESHAMHKGIQAFILPGGLNWPLLGLTSTRPLLHSSQHNTFLSAGRPHEIMNKTFVLSKAGPTHRCPHVIVANPDQMHARMAVC